LGMIEKASFCIFFSKAKITPTASLLITRYLFTLGGHVGLASRSIQQTVPDYFSFSISATRAASSSRARIIAADLAIALSIALRSRSSADS
jgi:hypothetical protein